MQQYISHHHQDHFNMPGSGADPGTGKGRGTNRLSCRWLGKAKFSC